MGFWFFYALKNLSKIACNRLQKELLEWQVNPPAGFKHKVTDNLQRSLFSLGLSSWIFYLFFKFGKEAKFMNLYTLFGCFCPKKKDVHVLGYMETYYTSGVMISFFLVFSVQSNVVSGVLYYSHGDLFWVLLCFLIPLLYINLCMLIGFGNFDQKVGD